jgi:hypothetical protein
VYGIFKTRGKDADDLRRVPVDGEGAAKQSRVGAEAPLPETVCQDWRGSYPEFPSFQTGAERRRNADNIENSGETTPANTRSAPARFCHDSGMGYSAIPESWRLIAPVQETGGDRTSGHVRGDAL